MMIIIDIYNYVVLIFRHSFNITVCSMFDGRGLDSGFSEFHNNYSIYTTLYITQI